VPAVQREVLLADLAFFHQHSHVFFEDLIRMLEKHRRRSVSRAEFPAGPNYFQKALDSLFLDAYYPRMHARKQLARWLKRSHYNQLEAAAELGMHWTHFSQILNGRRNPGLRNAVKIEDLTGIPVKSWLPLGPGQSGSSDRDETKSTQVGIE
jgi:plasmid maintenance system antidote protein VapI